MTLHHAAADYLIYLKSLRLRAPVLAAYRRSLPDILAFYGPDAALQDFDNSLVLEYIRYNDPFTAGPAQRERGRVFCKFVHWLMKNRLIPAWAEEMEMVEQDQRQPQSNLDDFLPEDDLLF